MRNVNKWGVPARPIDAVATKFKNAAIWPNQPGAAKTAEISICYNLILIYI